MRHKIENQIIKEVLENWDKNERRQYDFVCTRASAKSIEPKTEELTLSNFGTIFVIWNLSRALAVTYDRSTDHTNWYTEIEGCPTNTEI